MIESALQILQHVLPFLCMKHTQLAHILWASILKPGDICVDATPGNGHDSLALATLALGTVPGKLHIFDIQTTALENTRKQLLDIPENQLSFHQMCHSRLLEVVAPKSVKLIVFNLGYLPGGDKSIT